MKYKKLYKYLREDLKSNSGDHTWKPGEWYKIEGKLDICNKGFHASKTPLQALEYVAGEILAEVEVRGKSVVQDDKECWSEMRLVKTYKWQKKDSVALSIFAAELVIENYEKEYPNDTRPRDAIEAAKRVLADDTEENRSAARSAWSAARSAAWSAWSAARSARSAWSAARSARSAESAARSARSAAWSAARSARSARSAESAARSAARSARSAAWSAKTKLVASLDAWFEDRITNHLEEYK